MNTLLDANTLLNAYECFIHSGATNSSVISSVINDEFIKQAKNFDFVALSPSYFKNPSEDSRISASVKMPNGHFCVYVSDGNYITFMFTKREKLANMILEKTLNEINERFALKIAKELVEDF